jgi:hypothetical protein
MNEREARETDCQSVREQLATLRGGALLRGPLRRHVRGCEGCRAFRDQTRKQHQALALLLPVIPTAGLKAATMGAALGGAASGGAATATGGGVIAGLAAGGKAGAAKLLVAVALAGGGVGAGVVEVQHLRNDATPAPGERHRAPGAKHGTSTLTPAGTTSTAIPGVNGRRHGAHGKPASSPAASGNAATGKGIAGTQPGHGNGVTGTAGAPGQLKKTGATSHGKAGARGRVKPTRPVRRRPKHIAPLHPIKPVTPVKPTEPTVEEQPTETVPSTTTTDASTDTITTTGNAQAKQ